MGGRGDERAVSRTHVVIEHLVRVQPVPLQHLRYDLVGTSGDGEVVDVTAAQRVAQRGADVLLGEAHVGDHVTSTTLLTTVDENAQLEAYIYVPTERAANLHSGLTVQIVTSRGDLIETTQLDFVAPTVDNSLQGILAKAPIKSSLDRFRSEQLVKARVIWSNAPAPTVPVLSVTRIGGQTFVYVAEKSDKGTFARQRAVTLGDTLGNDYAVTGGLKPGDNVIISGIQFLVDGAPVQPLG